MARILVLFYSRTGATLALARHVCRGIESVAGATAVLRTVPAVVTPPRPRATGAASGPAYATLRTWQVPTAWVLGSPLDSAIWLHRSNIFWRDGALWASGAWPADPRPSSPPPSPCMAAGNHAPEHDLPLFHHGMVLWDCRTRKTRCIRRARVVPPMEHTCQRAGERALEHR